MVERQAFDSLVFWQNTPSIHQVSLLESIAKLSTRRVVSICEFPLPTSRRAHGWTPASSATVEFIVDPDDARRASLEAELEGGIHIFSGFDAYPRTCGSLTRLLRSSARTGVMAEAADSRGMKGFLRRFKYSIASRRFREIDFLLASGKKGVEWFSDCGFAESRIFEFGYFVSDGTSAPASRAAGCDLRLVFVGALESHKGVDLLLNALARLDEAYNLSIIGSGSMESALRTLAHQNGTSSRVRWEGSLPNPEVRERLSSFDILVLPSRYDGWGAVVNEALAAGTPAVVSDACGSASLVRPPHGEVFSSGDFQALACKIKQVAARRTSVSAQEIRKWADASISPDAGARYFLSIIDHVFSDGRKPRAPWS